MNNRQPQTNGSAYNRQPTARTNRPTQNPQQRTAQQQPVRTTRPPQTPQKKKKLKFKPNKEGILSLIALLLIVATVVVLLTVGIKAIVGAFSNENEETNDQSSTADEQTEVPTGKWNDDFITVSIPSSDVAVGDLILVNFENEYTLTDTLSSKLSALYTSKGYGTYYVLNGSDVKVHTRIKSALQDMIFALVDANPDTLGNVSGEDRIIITSGHRSTEKQTDLYNKRTEESYVAVPGHSEHHTGYAVDIQVFTKNQKIVLMRDEEQAWMEAHCAEFGFVVRYDGSKFELTGILDEPWHYRYVGVPHATYMMENSLCMEEYLKLIRESHTYDKEPLRITAGEKEYITYYVPVSEEAITAIPVPAEGEYTVSGDNLNGFIITVEVSESETTNE